MPFQPVILWTDALVFLLVGAALGTCVHLRGREHLAAPWRRVAASSSGMAGLTVLLVFIAIGLLDSLHFRERLEPGGPGQKAVWSVEVTSVLDSLLRSLREKREKTYSAPLAWQLYSKETVESTDGRQTREYPRLRHGGAHLADPAGDVAADVSLRALSGAALGVVIWAVLATIVCAGVARRRGSDTDATWRAIRRGETDIPWRAVLATLLVLLVAGCVIGSLATRYHVFGTSKVGQDVLYQTLKSVRTGLVIGTLTTLITLPFAVLLGIAAGFFRGWVDDTIQYIYTTLNSIPSVLLIAAAVLMMQVYIDTRPELFQTSAERADLKLLLLCVILGVTSWTSLCRLLRGETLKIRELEYIQAAQAFGVSHARIIGRHILPNVMHIVLISIVMEFSSLVLAEAVLSYIGVGVDPSMISFGTMINAARLEMAREPMVWWSLASAFVFMFLLVLSANLFADAVRDAFDPRAAVRSRFGLRAMRAAR